MTVCENNNQRKKEALHLKVNHHGKGLSEGRDSGIVRGRKGKNARGNYLIHIKTIKEEEQT